MASTAGRPSLCKDCNALTMCCSSCDNLLCGECTTWVSCQANKCVVLSCNDCVQSDSGMEEVKHCLLCDGIFCSACKPMEYCTCVNGDVCFECHIKNHDIIECYWQQLPSKLIQLVSNYDDIELTKDNFCQIFQECKQFIGTDKEFDQDSYKETIRAHRASYILAADYLLKDKDKKAFYMMLYGSLMREILECGPDRFMKSSQQQLMQSKLLSFTISNTSSRAKIANFLHLEHCFVDQYYHEEARLKDMIGKIQQRTECKIHSIKTQGEIHIHTYNEDSGKTDSNFTYMDAPLGWWLKVHTLRCNLVPYLQSPKITPSTKYFRIIHKEKTIFVSSSRNKTLKELGIEEYDEIRVGGVEPGIDNRCRTTSTKSEKTNRKSKKSKKWHGPKTKKRGKKQASALPVLTEEETEMKHREAHSQQLTRVLEELKPLLKQIRTDLNNRTLHKPAPKVRATRPRTSQVEVELAATLTSLCLCGKAGKVAYPILVGEVSNLYKTSKASRKYSKSSRGKNPIATLDLHGLSHYEALKKLDESLPVWVANAMKGESPWVIPVDIICGGGSQVLSEVVKEWIRNNSQVANRPKNYS